MRRLIITTVVLFIAVIAVTVAYFKNLSNPGLHTSETMRYIPDDAALVFEFKNDDGFYDIFTSNKLFASVIGQDQLSELDTLRHQLLTTPPLKQFFDGQNTFISLHPIKNKTIELLITVAAVKGFKARDLDKISNQSNKTLLVSPINIEGKPGYTIYSGILKKRFYLLNKAEGIYTASFSKDLIDQAARYQPKKDKINFLALPAQQNNNALANLYVNYSRLDILLSTLFKNKNTEIFKGFKFLSAQAALNLDFKNDALLFTGFSNILQNQAPGYLNLFANQQPVVNQLQDIFPSTTAYSMSFAVSDAKKFKADLSDWQVKAKMQTEKDSIFAKVKAETGLNLIAEFNQVIGHEFAVVTTRYQERYAIISLNNGSAFKPVMVNISRMSTADIGQLTFNKLPFFLLGDAFSQFNRPWFIILDNYLVLANSESELRSYYDSYLNHKFQNKLSQYKQFYNLTSERSNVTWYINFKNAQPILKRDLAGSFYTNFERNEIGWKNFYAASYQLVASDKNFYTNFCMSLNQPDTTQNNQ
ncbi:MAG: hypothetical protein V4619_06125 [Bacteroidota bacterium]